ncbi:MAG: homoserine dehydrogenase [Lachnospiraceae bacterium]|nr:homoserine dehydrogenase [Lachnospiraceae bacterium]
MIKVAIFGYGTVGSGVFEVINKNHETIQKKLGNELEVKYVLDLRDFENDPVEKVLVHDVDVILNDPEVSIICETMGGERPAYDFTKRALENGKSVCTSNKELVEKHGAELIKIAEANQCSYLFEASVGGGIPIIRPLCTSLAQEEIESITGILNGTTNYILTKMEMEGADFDTVLKRAQEKGYAERNPEADICGYDAGRKIAILTSLAYGKNVDFADIYTEGITAISKADFEYVKQLGATIKLFAKSVHKDGKYYAMVAPFVVSSENPLYAVKNVFNAILVHGNMVADTMYYGKGAGKLATASAVVADVVDCAKHLGKHIRIVWEEEKLELSQIDSASRRFFVRVASTDKAEIENNFGKVEFLESVSADECGFITEEMTESEYKEKAAKAGNVINMIRMD